MRLRQRRLVGPRSSPPHAHRAPVCWIGRAATSGRHGVREEAQEEESDGRKLRGKHTRENDSQCEMIIERVTILGCNGCSRVLGVHRARRADLCNQPLQCVMSGDGGRVQLILRRLQRAREQRMTNCHSMEWRARADMARQCCPGFGLT